jgi:glutamate 5-kinase
MLLTYWDLDSRACTRNARATLDLLLTRKRFVPIINENDAIADEEIKVGDNDRLSAHVAALVGADLLVILSGIDGLMTKSDGTGTLIPSVRKIDDSVRALAGGAGSERNVGGMVTKLQAAEIAAEGKVDTIIASGRRPDILLELAAGKKIGTRFSLRK